MKIDRCVDLAVVGAGILGLAHALAAAKRGLSVAIFERDEQPIGASVRNFGLVLAVGLTTGAMRERALRSREIWLELADKAQFAVEHSGCVIIANHRDEWDVLQESYMQAEDSQYRLMAPRETLVYLPMLQNKAVRGCLWSPYELQVDPREAILSIARYLKARYGVRLVNGVQVQGIDMPRIETSSGNWYARRAIVCPGDDFQTLYPELLSGLTRCKLQMLRTVPQRWRLPCVMMTGLSLLHYPAFAQCHSLPRLRQRLEADRAELLQYGIHLIVCQGADGHLVLGDSHHYGLTPSPFNSGHVEELLLQQGQTLLNISDPRVAERWFGVYAYSDEQDYLIATPAPSTRLVLVTSGTDISISFALAEEVIEDVMKE